MKEKCAEQPIPSCPPHHPVCAGKSAIAAPTGMVVLGSLACRLWAFFVHKLVWVLILLLCSQTPKLLNFQLSTAVQTWLSVVFHFTDLIQFHWDSKSNKCTVSKILQVLLLFSYVRSQPAVRQTKKNGQKAARFLGLPRLVLPFTVSEGRVLSQMHCWSDPEGHFLCF